MDTYVLFLFKSVLVSGLLATWYCLGLRNKKLYQYNRFFLLFTLFASLAVPLLHFNWFTIHETNTSSVPAKYLLHIASGSINEEPQIAGKF